MKKLNNKASAEMIMGVVVSLIILAVGVFAFFVTLNAINDDLETEANDSSTKETIDNTSKGGTEVFNIIGIVMIIGAIMAVVGLVYNYVRPDYSPPSRRSRPSGPTLAQRVAQRANEKKEKEQQEKQDKIKKEKAKKHEKYYKKGRSSRTAKAAMIIDEKRSLSDKLFGGKEDDKKKKK